MWCDNCLLVLPLRAGAIAWAVAIAVYSLAGGLFLLMYGQYVYFVYPEWFIYGGIGIGVCALSVINMITMSNRSYTWSRVCHFLWPFIIVICAVRAIFMIWELHRGREKIIWECENGGQLWGQSEEQGYGNSMSFPNGICAPGWQSLFTAFIFLPVNRSGLPDVHVFLELAIHEAATTVFEYEGSLRPGQLL